MSTDFGYEVMRHSYENRPCHRAYKCQFQKSSAPMSEVVCTETSMNCLMTMILRVAQSGCRGRQPFRSRLRVWSGVVLRSLASSWLSSNIQRGNGSSNALSLPAPQADRLDGQGRCVSATQALPNAYCRLPVQKSCPHSGTQCGRRCVVETFLIECAPLSRH